MAVIIITRTNPGRDVGDYRDESSFWAELLFSRRQMATLRLGFEILC